MKQLFVLLLATIFLSACGTTSTVSQSEISKPIARDQARIIVTRDSSFLYMAGAATIRSNGTKIASLGIGGSVAHDVRAGQNVLEVSTPTASGQFVINFNAKPRKTYEFTVSPRSGALISGSAFGMVGDAINASVSEQSGYFEIQPADIRE